MGGLDERVWQKCRADCPADWRTESLLGTFLSALTTKKDWGKAYSTLRLVQGSNLNHWQCLCCLESGVQVGGAARSGQWTCTKFVPKCKSEVGYPAQTIRKLDIFHVQILQWRLVLCRASVLPYAASVRPSRGRPRVPSSNVSQTCGPEIDLRQENYASCLLGRLSQTLLAQGAIKRRREVRSN